MYVGMDAEGAKAYLESVINGGTTLECIGGNTTFIKNPSEDHQANLLMEFVQINGGINTFTEYCKENNVVITSVLCYSSLDTNPACLLCIALGTPFDSFMINKHYINNVGIMVMPEIGYPCITKLEMAFYIRQFFEIKGHKGNTIMIERVGNEDLRDAFFRTYVGCESIQEYNKQDNGDISVVKCSLPITKYLLSLTQACDKQLFALVGDL